MQLKFSKQTLFSAFGACLLLALGVACTAARAQDTAVPPFNEVHTIAVPGTPTPVEHEFTLVTTGSYQVVLTDLGAQLPTPAPLASVTLIVTTGNAIVGKTLVGPGTLQFNATVAGTYTVHVVGTPGAGTGSGPIGIQIGTASSPASVGSYSDNIAVPAGTTLKGEAVLDDSFTVAASGSYTLSLVDLQLPQSLGQLTLALTAQGAPNVLQVLPDSSNNNAMHATVSLQSGVTYRVTAVGLVASGAAGGLFSAVVVPVGGGSPVYGNAVPVGATTLIGTPALTAGDHTVTLTDLAFPAALTQVGAAVVLTGQSALAAPVTAAGTQTFSAAGGTYQVFGVATPQATSPAAGAYSIQIQPAGSGSPDLSVARTVTGSGSGLSAYSFDTTLAGAGNYAVGLQDFSFPVAFNSLRLAAVQGGALVGTPLISSGTLNASAQAGPITLLVIGQPDPAHGGVFDVNITAAGSTKLLFDATQGAGAAFIARKVSITTAGSYGINSSDVGFPAAFGNLAVIVTQGSNTLGSVFSLGSVSLSNAASGDYFINIVAQPSGNAGTYALSMSAAPTVTLTPSATSVTQGGTVTLTWSSQNATKCTATGGWSGTEPVSGSLQTSAINATTTFTLACTGPGGTTTVSATVTANSAPAKSGGGGGGEIDSMLVLGLGVLIARRLLTSRKK